MNKTKKIVFLPPIVANQIAAGEVVQRPASAVKELLENALDAGSTSIHILIEDGGKKLIQIKDNGIGMSLEDIKICYHPHATSKIQKAEDLYQLKTYGFRGEALSAIAAAAAKVEIMSRRANSEVGHKITLENGDLVKEESVAMPEGTQIRVHHLFGNIPARLHFLKSNAVEMHHILETLQRTALARTDVTFSLHNKKEEVLHLPASKLSHRIIHMLGKKYQKQLISCQESTHNLSIKGYIGTPSQAKKGNRNNYFFVNNRYIKSSYLHHAVKKAFENLILPDSSPFYVLFIEVNPSEVDVNVHPTKTEVKFEHEKIVYTLISSSVRKSLGSHQIIPSIDFNSTNNTIFSKIESSQPLANIVPNLRNTVIKEIPSQPFLSMSPSVDRKSGQIRKPLEREVPKKEIIPEKMQIHNQYILTGVKSGILIIDQEAAYERILYQQNKRNLSKAGSSTQQTLFPEEIELSVADLIILKEAKREIESLGFRFEIKKNNTILITGQPPNVQGKSAENLLLDTIDEYKRNTQDTSLTSEEKWARALAKKAKPQYKKKLTLQEMDHLVESLFLCENPNFTLDGKPIWRILELEELANIIAGKCS